MGIVKTVMRCCLFFLMEGCCASAPHGVPVEVKVPIAVPCRQTLPEEPDWNVPRLARDANAITEAKAELADLDLGKGYIAQLRAALKACG